MTKRTQVNYRIDVELLEAIKAAAKAQGISYTDWINRACRDKLGMSLIAAALQPSSIPPADRHDLEATLENLLDKRIVQLEQRVIEQLEDKLKGQQMGELAA